ncbi:MAG: glycosyltransferase family 2 protein [Chloroflexota bacterium]
MITVLMPAHNAELYLEEAVDSILNQTFTDYEFIIVNDSSTDRTQEIIERYAAQDDRIMPLQVSVRSASAARNVGLEYAKGDYVALMDSDDIAMPDRLEKQFNAAMEQPDVTVWGCYMQYMTEDGISMGDMTLGPPSREAFEALDRTKHLITVYGTVAFFRRDICEQVGRFDLRFIPTEDSELWDRMAEHGPVIVVPEVLQLYRQHSKSLSFQRAKDEFITHGYIKARYAARRRGETLELEDYIHEHGLDTKFAQFGMRMRGVSMGHGRRARISFAKKQYLQAFASSVMTIVTHPMRFVRQIDQLPGVIRYTTRRALTE